MAQNVVKHGCGALNIDATRIPTVDENFARPAVYNGEHEGWQRPWKSDPEALKSRQEAKDQSAAKAEALGRWPANVAHDGSDEVLEAFAAFGESKSRMADRGFGIKNSKNHIFGDDNWQSKLGVCSLGHEDQGTAARFFFSAKASTSERGEGNQHPTVKPLALMQYLVRLITPRGGTVLDPFAGSGSTLVAADREAMHAIGIELSPEYADILRRRYVQDAGLFAEIST